MSLDWKVTHTFAALILIDFSKAFDIVDHLVLLKKMSKLDLPPSIFQWIASFLSGRQQTTKLGADVSSPLSINRGIVQGSALGPTLYTTMESDIRTLSLSNLLFKYADDTNLLVPEHTDVGLTEEFDHVKKMG